MKIANNLSKVELKKSEEAVTGKIGLGWMADSLRHFGIKKMISDEHGDGKRSNRQKGAYEKIMTGAMMMASGGQRIEDVENLRVDQGLLDSLGWEEMICADTSTVSKHLSVLKNAGLVSDEKRGNSIYYTLRCTCILDFIGCVEDVLSANAKEHYKLLKSCKK